MIQRERTEIVNQTDWEKKGSVGALINLSGQDEDKDAKKEKIKQGSYELKYIGSGIGTTSE